MDQSGENGCHFLRKRDLFPQKDKIRTSRTSAECSLSLIALLECGARVELLTGNVVPAPAALRVMLRVRDKETKQMRPIIRMRLWTTLR